MSTEPPQQPTTRHPLQRELGASYDFWHALLVRAVHPLAFGAFLLATLALCGVIGAIVWEVGDSDVAGIGFAAVVALIGAVIAAFTFVFTIPRGITTILFVAGLGVAMLVVDDIDTWLLWTIWSIAAASVALQVGMLCWVVPRRVRAGLLHLLLPATLGTAIGALPVVAGLGALADGHPDAALRIAQVAVFATAAAIAALLVVYLIVRHDDREVVNDFVTRHRKVKHEGAADSNLGAPLTQKLVPTWSRVHRYATVMLEDERKVAVTTGFTASRAPDVPSLHLTVLALATRRGAGALPDLWVRRRSLRHDNLLVNTAHTPVVRFESIALDEDWSFRFAPGTTELEAYTEVGPQVLELLERSLGAAQVCRTGGTWFAWIVGGATSADELDGLVELLVGLDALLVAHPRSAV